MGIIPDTRRRLPFDDRWPGVLENALNARGRAVRVIEDCLNGRRTVDGIHLDADQRRPLGEALVGPVGRTLA